MFKKIFTVLFAIFVTLYTLGGILQPVYAQTSEAERNKQLAKELTLNLPEQVDDPNYPVTFVDPSKKGVEITLDGKTTPNAPSPFLLPNVTVGTHEIIFKYTNADGLVRVLSQTLYMVPKPPTFDDTIKTTVVRPSQVILSGTAIPQSTVQLIVNSQISFKATTNTEGKWEFTLPNPTEGKLYIIAQTVRNGFVSEVSKPITVEYKLDEGTVIPQLINPNESWQDVVTHEFESMVAQVEQYKTNNPNEFYIIVGVTIALILLAFLLSLRKQRSKKREEKDIAALFGDAKNARTILDIVSESPEITNMTKDSNTENIVTTVTEVKQEVFKKKKGKKPSKKKAELSTTENETEKVAKTTKKVVVVKQPKKKGMKITVESLNETQKDDKEEAPTRKILSKEEFLKKFKPKNARTE